MTSILKGIIILVLIGAIGGVIYRLTTDFKTTILVVAALAVAQWVRPLMHKKR